MASEEVGNLLVRISADMSNLESGMRNASEKAESFHDKMMSLGKAIAGAFVVEKVVDFFKSSVEEAGKMQDQMAQLDAVLKSTGEIAGVTGEQVVGLAEHYSGLTKFSKEAILGSENLLLTFTKIGKDVFPDATLAVLNLATKMKSDLKSASIEVGKALQDPITGITALHRVGVELDAQQKQQIKSFMAVGDIASAQKIIIKELTTEMGNSALMAGLTFPGKVEILGHKFEELKEKIGDKLIPILADLVDWFSAHMPEIQKYTETAFDKVSGAFKWAQDNAKILKPLIEALVIVFGLYEAGLAAVAIKTNVLKLATETQIVAQNALKVATGIATAAQWLFNIALDANPIGVVIIAIGLIGAAIVILTGHFNDIVKAIENAWNWLTKWNKEPAKSKTVEVTQHVIPTGNAGVSSFTPGETGNNPLIPKFATGTNFVPYDMVAQIHKGEAVVPAKNNPSNPNASNPMNNNGNISFAGAIFNVRSDNDIKAIAKEIFNLQKTRARSSGIIPAT